jgi:hypothetical protein
MHENRETSSVSPSNRDRSGKAERRTPDVYAGEESDRAVVPVKPPNKGAQALAEVVVEERARVRENTGPPHTRPTQCGIMRVPGTDRCAVGGVAPAATIHDESRMR